MKLKSIYVLMIAILLSSSISVTFAQDSSTGCKHTPIEIKDIDAQNALVMKADIPMSAIGEKMGEMYGKLFTYIGEKGLQPAGPPFAVYYSWDPEGNIVFEAGVPVASEVEGTDEIVYKEFPVMKAVSTLYTGSYEGMEPVYNHIRKYIEDNELESVGNSWEVYLTDPQLVEDPNDNKTLIYFPIK